MIKLDEITQIYFLGIGGIGMSALARYFHASGFEVSGYDKTETKLTKALVAEGIEIEFKENLKKVEDFDRETSLICYTPAIPKAHSELLFFQVENYNLVKRAELLGFLSAGKNCLAVAGTHGKTTTSSILAYLLSNTEENCSAFLGGIASNFNSNLLISESKNVVVEADEFDRSFLHLHPNYAILTSTDADHLDIYGDEATIRQGFQEFVDRIPESGALIAHESCLVTHSKKVSYGEGSENDYVLEKTWVENESYYASFSGKILLEKVKLGLAGQHNALNALAALALCNEMGLNTSELTPTLAGFKGIKRRFETHIKREDLVYVDDYAHHPSEIKYAISSLRELYPERKLTVAFQPHLFSRTRDFELEFATELSKADELFLLDIYPAREEPIEGINSKALLEKIHTKSKHLSSKKDLAIDLKSSNPELIATLGAGDIDTCIDPIIEIFQQ